MISEEVYLEMKKHIANYESKQTTFANYGSEKSIIEQPYIDVVTIESNKKYNPNYGDDRICKCGHPYYRHFDSYEDMIPVGCKYCECYTFKEAN